MATDSADSTNRTPPPGRAYEVLTPGEKFGDYQILKCLSYDLMGSLYQVRKTRQKDNRTLFVLPPLVKGDSSFRERCFQASSKLSKLDHPGILKIEDVDTIKNRFVLFQEDFDGQNLADYLESIALDKQGKQQSESDELLADIATGLPEDEVKDILNQILEALEYAHSQRVLHLNLNPTNILRNEEGQIKLVELGLMSIAGKSLFEELVSAGIPPISLGPRRIRINTVDILAPEVRMGKEGDERADIYAFGITAYWLLTGQKPSYEYKPPSELNPDINPHWDTLIANCLERRQEKRYGSAKSVLKDLNNLNEVKERIEPLEPGTSETKSVFRHIDFIPVPKQIKKRGKGNERAFRLAVIGVFAVVFAYIVISFYSLAFSGDAIPEGNVAIRTPEGKKPKLSFSLEPESAMVTLSREKLSFPVQDGQLELNILPGNYRFEFTAPHHKKQIKLLAIEDKPQQITIALEPSMADVEILTNPGVRALAINSNGKTYNLGLANDDGVLMVADMLMAGEYTLRMEKEDYLPLEIEHFKFADDKLNSVKYMLSPIPGTLRVRSIPKDANIYIEGKELGLTNATISGLPVEEAFIVTLEKPGYRTKALEVTLPPNTSMVLDFGELTPRSSEIVPQLTFDGNPATTELLNAVTYHIGDQSYPGSASVLDRVPEGDVTLLVTHPAYLDITYNLKDLEDGRTYPLKLNMEAKPAVLTLAVSPDDIDLTVNANGRDYHLRELRTFSLKPYRQYHLTLDAPGYMPVHKSLLLNPNEKYTWDVTMEPIPGPVKNAPYMVSMGDIPMQWIPAGSFIMGSPKEENARLPEEGPQTEVTLTQGFWLGKYEVTQEQYREIMDKNPSEFRGENHPVQKVSWDDAMTFCRKINATERQAGRLPEGYVYRLPTEAEWEYAARAGALTPFYWGSTAGTSDANFRGLYPRERTTSVLEDPDLYGTTAVGQYPPNAFGLYDMHGNVAEWCLDYYNGRLPGGSVEDWVRNIGGGRRVVRGGGWETNVNRARAASRTDSLAASTISSSIGFRLCLGPDLENQ